jgi:putative ABC transport system permease protein
MQRDSRSIHSFTCRIDKHPAKRCGCSLAPEGRLTLANALREELRALDLDLPVRLGPYALEERMAEVYWNSELYAWLFAVFATIALCLAAFGLYSTVAYSVSQDVQEIGIRMAMGAKNRDVIVFVLRRGMRPVVAGLVIGLGLSFGATHVLSSLLPGSSSTDPFAYFGAATVLVLVALLGCWIPARSALRVSPVAVLTK